MTYDFSKYKKDSLTKPRDLAWAKPWGKFEKVGDKVSGYIRDVFYRPEEEQFKEQRGFTLEQENGELINVGIKRLPFILDKTDDLRLGDPLVIELTELKKSATKGFSATKIQSFFGSKLPENDKNKTVLELESEDRARGGSKAPVADDSKKPEEETADDVVADMEAGVDPLA